MNPGRPNPPPRLGPGGGFILLTAAAGAISLLALAVGGAANPPLAVACAAAVALLGLALAINTAMAQRRPAPGGAATAAPVATPLEPRFRAMLDGLGDPVLLVAGADPEDPAGHRYLFANAAARAVLPIQRSQGLLTTVVRAPEALQAVDRALFGEGVGEASFQSGGVQARLWRARASRLVPEQDAGDRFALLTLRDETQMLASVRSRSDFLANASHELRTPLASLTGFIETLSGHARDDTAARERFLPIMQAQANRMRRLIENLMRLSSIEQAEHLAPCDEVDLAAAAADVVDALAPQAQARGVRFENAIAMPALVVGDRDQILQVIQNLTENALKYAPPGAAVGLRVAADLDLQECLRPSMGGGASHSLLTPAPVAGVRYAALSVRDPGRGIARTNLPRLTERFYRVEGQKGGELSGAGLGLAIVKHIMNRHRGGLGVESVEGAGSTFTAYFPMPAR